MRLLNGVFTLIMLIIFGYLWTIKSSDLSSLPFLGLAILGTIFEVEYKIDDLFKNENSKLRK